jgi:ribosome-binding factor A
MPSRRLEKAAEAIREVVSMAILTELQDPRIRDVTVTHVEVSPDLRYAKVHVSVMGDETRQKLSLRGLQSAAGFLQAKIAERIDIRYTPKLNFMLDQGVKRSIAVAKILREVLPPEPSPAPDQSAAQNGLDANQSEAGDSVRHNEPLS